MSYKWAEKGKQPKVEQKQSNKERVTLFGGVDRKRGIVITQKAERGNAITFKKFLKKILRKLRKYKGKIWLILDNVKYHHAKLLKPFLDKYKDRLILVFLPPYSPDLNHMERVWWYMRKKITHNRYIKTLHGRMVQYWQLISHFQKPNDFIPTLCNLNYSV